MARAILPNDWQDPAGTEPLERQAMKEYRRRVRAAVAAYKRILAQIPQEIEINKRYRFQLYPALLKRLFWQADLEVEAAMLEGGETQPWFFERFVSAAATRGTAQQFRNIGQQSAAYKAGRKSVKDILRSDAYLRRMAMARARVFEEMKGLTSTLKQDLARVLMDGVGRGQSPTQIAKTLTERGIVAEGRADMVARTEVTMALKRARWDESQEAATLYNLTTKELHLSALAPTTRAHHAARHGRLFDMDAVQDWWAQDANAINCRCTTVSVMVDEAGNPVAPEIVAKAKQVKDNMEKRDYAWADKD